MNENYIERYVDINGNVCIRKTAERIRMIAFAGTKFLFDRVMAVIGLILLSPLMLVISIAIKLDSKGPVFFKQERTGKNGKNFYMYKFRSMVKDNDVHDFSRGDKHTRVGRFLRKTSLDEIPQLFSIAIGKMSFIGPRPWIPDYFNNMNEIQRHRYCVRPGLTGLAQANGRNAITIHDKIKYDLEYIQNYSLRQDLKVIFLTIKAVFTARGADAGKGGIEKDICDLKECNRTGRDLNENKAGKECDKENNIKKVLFTATVDSHISHFHIPYLKLFKENGYEVHVATNGNEKIPYCDVKHIISFERSPIKTNNLKAIGQLKKICEKEKFDIIHTHTPMGSVVTRLAAKEARRKYNTRVIYTAHGFHFYKGAPILNWLVYYPIEKWLAKYTDTLITINKEDYELAKKKFSKRCKNIEYVPGVGIDENKFNITLTDKEKNELKASLGLKKDDYVLTCVARLDKNKNQGLLIDAMEELVKRYKNIHLLLVGPDELNGIYEEKARKMGLIHNIHFLGYRKDVMQILKITNICVSSSSREGLPVNIMEAMACGVPVVAFKCRGMQELITNSQNGLIVDSKEEYVNGIQKIYNNKNLQEFICKNNIVKIENYYLNSILGNMKRIYFQKKRILHLLASNKFSGAENVACTIINNTSDNYESAYCCPDGVIREQLEEFNINYKPLNKLSYAEIKRIVYSFNPDIIHAHDNKATIFATLFQKRCRIISHIHGNNIIMNRINLKTLLFNFCSKKVDAFIWVSKSSFDGYVFNKNVKNKSFIICNVVDQNRIIYKSNEYIEQKKYDLIFLGRLGYPKNPKRLIEIIKLLKLKKRDISVAIVGEGEESQSIRNMVNKYKLKKNVHFYGFRKNPYPILKNSKILIMTSIYEGTPMSALEAQALGKPIVATPVDGLTRIVKDDFNGYLSNDNNVIANKIIYILNNNCYNEFSKNSKVVFSKINNIQDYILNITKIYERKKYNE